MRLTRLPTTSQGTCTSCAIVALPCHRGFLSPSLSRHRSHSSTCTIDVKKTRVTRCSSSPSSTIAPLSDAVAALSDSDKQLWSECQSIVEEVGIAPADSQRILGRAFGWTGQAFWRTAKENEIPTPDQLYDALNFLREQGIDGADLTKVIKSFPEVLACDINSQLEPNVAKLIKDWGLKGGVLTKTLVRSPHVLGYNVDCEGNCIGECNRCWVRF